MNITYRTPEIRIAIEAVTQLINMGYELEEISDVIMRVEEGASTSAIAAEFDLSFDEAQEMVKLIKY